MSNSTELSKELATEQGKLAEIEEDIRSELGSWARAQAEFVQNFFRREGKLTVVNQSAVTTSIPELIPALRERVEQIADDAARAILALPSGLSDEATFETVGKLRTAYERLVAPAAASFADAMTSAGYSPNDLHSSRDWGGDQPWMFYVPSSGSARTEKVPSNAAASSRLEVLHHARKSSGSRIASLQAEISQANAASLWGED